MFAGEGEFEYSNDLWSFDLNSNTWMRIVESGDTWPAPVSGINIAILGDQLYYFFGFGLGNQVNYNFSAYSISDRTWRIEASPFNQDWNPIIPTAYYLLLQTSATQVTIYSGMTLFDDEAEFYFLLYQYESTQPQALAFKQINPLVAAPPPLFGSTLTLLGERLMLYGGIEDENVQVPTLWSYNLLTYSWNNYSGFAPAPPARAQHVAWSSNFQLFISGGINVLNVYANQVDTWMFSIAFNNWTRLADAPISLGGGTGLVHLSKQEVALFGGFSSSIAFPMLTFNLETFNWTMNNNNLLFTRGFFATSNIGTSIYIFGGVDESDLIYADMWLLDWSTQSMRQLFMDNSPPPVYSTSFTQIG